MRWNQFPKRINKEDLSGFARSEPGPKTVAKAACAAEQLFENNYYLSSNLHKFLKTKPHLEPDASASDKKRKCYCIFIVHRVVLTLPEIRSSETRQDMHRLNSETYRYVITNEKMKRCGLICSIALALHLDSNLPADLRVYETH
jgi:hypothetical protein